MDVDINTIYRYKPTLERVSEESACFIFHIHMCAKINNNEHVRFLQPTRSISCKDDSLVQILTLWGSVHLVLWKTKSHRM